MATKEVLIDIKGDQKNLDSAIKKANSALSSIANTAAKAGAAFVAMGTSFAAFSTKEALPFEGLQRAFNRMVSAQGEDADEFMMKMQEMSSNTVTQAEIMKRANMGMLLGLDTGSLLTFMEAATTISQATGESVSYMFESLTTGTARQSKLWLDNLGILVDLEKVNQDYADSLGVTTNELTDNQKRIAFVNAANDAAKQKLEDLGGYVVDTKSKWDQLTTAFKDNSVALGQRLMPELDKVLTWTLENKDWMISTFQEIFQVDTEAFGDRAVEELDKIKEWTDNNKQALADTWFWIKEGVDATITSVKVLYMSLAELYAFEQYLMSGGTDESLKALQTTSHEVANMYKDIGQKPWSQAIVSTLTGNASASSVPYTKGMWGDARVYAPSGQPVYKDPLYDITRASYKLIQLKLDSSTTKDLMSGQTVTITANAAMTGT
jgi:hypothetical protein